MFVNSSNFMVAGKLQGGGVANARGRSSDAYILSMYTCNDSAGRHHPHLHSVDDPLAILKSRAHSCPTITPSSSRVPFHRLLPAVVCFPVYVGIVPSLLKPNAS